ncbi:hypothetical protein B0H17DRAFT_1149635 [Mycena rosella]|uniref:Uncharacterized protein n=1 Tax=Mycena rosella TaxID=1033263 RepID=A0AAD7FPL0_MYCRO|nr:hypothetical protein B0H17DRAFT_1149635 [Mycena rosella]
MAVYGPPELPFGTYFDHTRANWNYVSYQRIETKQSLHFLAQTGVRVFMHCAFHEYLKRAVRILNPDLTESQVRVLAQGYRERHAYPAPHRSRGVNPWESVHLLPQSWIGPRAGWPDNMVGWNSRDRSFDIQRFLTLLDVYMEHREWDLEVGYEEGAIASAHFLEGEELRDLVLELGEDTAFVYGLPNPNPAAPPPSPASSSDEEPEPRVAIAPAALSPVGIVPQVECVIEVELSESEEKDKLFGSGEESVSEEEFIPVPPRSPPSTRIPNCCRPRARVSSGSELSSEAAGHISMMLREP